MILWDDAIVENRRRRVLSNLLSVSLSGGRRKIGSRKRNWTVYWHIY